MDQSKKVGSLAKTREKSTAIAAVVFLLPALILIVVYMIYPVIDTFAISAYSWNGISADRIYVGLQNWKTLNEKDKLVDDQNQVSVELVEEDGKYYLKTNVYDVMKAFKVGLIDSDLLGCAFEPEQRFENPDGTSILFDTDYLGEHRGVASIPGPFASAEAAAKLLWED